MFADRTDAGRQLAKGAIGEGDARVRAACEVARAHGAARVVLAVPVAPGGWRDRLAGAADELVAVTTPDRFAAVGEHYVDFAQTTEDEVIEQLRHAAEQPPPGSPRG